jgi:hypothetical protein
MLYGIVRNCNGEGYEWHRKFSRVARVIGMNQINFDKKYAQIDK